MPNNSPLTDEDVFKRLAEPIPETFILSLPKGKGEKKQSVDYITWSDAATLLDERAPGWEAEIVEVGERGGKIFVRLAITICGVRRENIGHEDTSTDSYGDPFSNAYAQAFKRTALLFIDYLKAGEFKTARLGVDSNGARVSMPAEPGQVADWACSKDKRRRVLDLRSKLREHKGATDDWLAEDAQSNFPPGDITQMDDGEIGKYIAHLVKHLNRREQPERRSA